MRNGHELQLVLTHTPDNIYALRDHGFDAVFAGHYHGGQIRAPGLGPFVVPSKYGRRYDRGHFVFGRTHLFVTAGVGSAEPPLRIWCPPDVLVVDFLPGEEPYERRPGPDRRGRSPGRAGLATLLADLAQHLRSPAVFPAATTSQPPSRRTSPTWCCGTWAGSPKLRWRAWRQEPRTLPVVALLNDEADARQAWRVGAQGLLPRDASPDRIAASLHRRRSSP